MSELENHRSFAEKPEEEGCVWVWIWTVIHSRMKTFSQEWNDRFMVSWGAKRDIPTTVSLRQPYTSLRRWPPCEHPALLFRISPEAASEPAGCPARKLCASLPDRRNLAIEHSEVWAQVARVLGISLRWGCFKWDGATEKSCRMGENGKESLDDRNKLRNVFKFYF